MLQPQGFTIFCEDIRDERSGQYSYIGIYDGTLYTPKVPARLRSLCVIVNIRQPEQIQAESIKVAIEFPNDAGPINETYDLNEVRKRGGVEGEEGVFTLQMRAKFVGVPITKTGDVTVTGEIDGEPCRFGTLRVELDDDD